MPQFQIMRSIAGERCAFPARSAPHTRRHVFADEPELLIAGSGRAESSFDASRSAWLCRPGGRRTMNSRRWPARKALSRFLIAYVTLHAPQFSARLTSPDWD